MPCGDTRSTDEFYARLALQDERDKWARMLCECIRCIELNNIDLNKLSTETNEWWIQHKKHDKENGR